MAKKNIKRKIYNYTAVFEPAEDGVFNVYFPALPGCVTFGKNLKHAKKMAKEVLELWLETAIEKKGKIPAEKQKPVIENFRISVPNR